MTGNYREKFIDEKRSNSPAYIFHHLEPGGLEADIDGLKENVEKLLQQIDSPEFWLSRNGFDLRFRVLGEMLSLILSDAWECI